MELKNRPEDKMSLIEPDAWGIFKDHAICENNTALIFRQ